MSGKRIIFGHSYWGRGGAEVAAMWILQSLCDEFQVDLVTRGGWDLDELNGCAGTAVRAESLGEVLVPSDIPGFGVAGGLLWHCWYLRRCRKLGRRYDLRITASRTLDWGLPAIHFLSDVAWNLALQRRFGCPEAESFAGPLRRVYSAVGASIAGRSGRDPAMHDVFVANSQWCAGIAAEYCTKPPVVIYPAVPGEGLASSWETRSDEFLCLGRISPEKRLEYVIAILDQVRILGSSIHLHVVGSGDDDGYVRQIRRLCDERAEWVTWHGPVFGPAKQELLGRCRYGISACDREAFGIATAEMVKAGIIPFVPRGGAQVEVVGDHALVYGDIEDGSLRIDAVLKSAARQLELHEAMRQRGAAFDSNHFCKAVRDLVSRQFAPSVRQ